MNSFQSSKSSLIHEGDSVRTDKSDESKLHSAGKKVKLWMNPL